MSHSEDGKGNTFRIILIIKNYIGKHENCYSFSLQEIELLVLLLVFLVRREAFKAACSVNCAFLSCLAENGIKSLMCLF